MSWKSERFQIAMPQGPVPRRGHTYRGLGIYQITAGSPKGRRPASWSLTHLGTGHLVAVLRAEKDIAFAAATEIAEAGDWDFDSLDGFKNRFPNAAEKVDAALLRHRAGTRSTGGGRNPDIARQIAEAR